MSESCCNEYVPAFSGFRQEGEEFTCPKCGKEWKWVVDESEGGFWDEVI